MSQRESAKTTASTSPSESPGSEHAFSEATFSKTASPERRAEQPESIADPYQGLTLKFPAGVQKGDHRASAALEDAALHIAQPFVKEALEWHSKAEPASKLHLKFVRAPEDTPEAATDWRIESRALEIAKEALKRMGINSQSTTFTQLHTDWEGGESRSVAGRKLTVFAA